MLAPDVRLPFQPAQFRQLTVDTAARRWWQRPVLLLFVLGCGLSAAATGRFTLRLIVDGMVSFAFVPAITIALLTMIGRPSASRMSFARAIDVFFVGYTGWLLWLVTAAGLTLVVPPRDLGPWIIPLEVSLLLPVGWGLIVDFHFFRVVAGRSVAASATALLVHRVVGWAAFVAYFEGRAAWSILQPVVMTWFGG